MRLVILICFLAIAGIPVYLITRSRPVVVQSSGELPAKKIVPFEITLTASTPAHLALAAVGQKPVESSPSAESLIATYSMDASKPEDLVVKARFVSPQKNAALRIQVQASGKMLKDATLWGSESIEDVISIP
ncbi:MAG: hypothetical protein EBS96_03285 [Spartobacteria bacterium]|nr:hypothetical protein [Spartobacteria bacterium]